MRDDEQRSIASEHSMYNIASPSKLSLRVERISLLDVHRKLCSILSLIVRLLRYSVMMSTVSKAKLNKV